MANDVHVTRKIATAPKRPPTGFEHLTLHDLRHSIASALINYGTNLFGGGAVLGHKVSSASSWMSPPPARTVWVSRHVRGGV